MHRQTGSLELEVRGRPWSWVCQGSGSTRDPGIPGSRVYPGPMVYSASRSSQDPRPRPGPTWAAGLPKSRFKWHEAAPIPSPKVGHIAPHPVGWLGAATEPPGHRFLPMSSSSRATGEVAPCCASWLPEVPWRQLPRRQTERRARGGKADRYQEPTQPRRRVTTTSPGAGKA